MHANVVVKNSENLLANSSVNEKSEWIGKIQLNIPWYVEYGKYNELFITS